MWEKLTGDTNSSVHTTHTHTQGVVPDDDDDDGDDDDEANLGGWLPEATLSSPSLQVVAYPHSH